MNMEWVELRVRNLEIQRQFYTRVLGLQDPGWPILSGDSYPV